MGVAKATAAARRGNCATVNTECALIDIRRNMVRMSELEHSTWRLMWTRVDRAPILSLR